VYDELRDSFNQRLNASQLSTELCVNIGTSHTFGFRLARLFYEVGIGVTEHLQAGHPSCCPKDSVKALKDDSVLDYGQHAATVLS